jgi:hypothetical protein
VSVRTGSASVAKPCVAIAKRELSDYIPTRPELGAVPDGVAPAKPGQGEHLQFSDYDAQVANAQAVDEYLRERYTNAALHRWLGSVLSRSYFQAYQLTFEIAKAGAALL